MQQAQKAYICKFLQHKRRCHRDAWGGRAPRALQGRKSCTCHHCLRILQTCSLLSIKIILVWWEESKVLLLYGFYAHVYTPIWDLQFSSTLIWVLHLFCLLWMNKKLMIITPWQSEWVIIKVSYWETFLIIFKWSNKS